MSLKFLLFIVFLTNFCALPILASAAQFEQQAHRIPRLMAQAKEEAWDWIYKGTYDNQQVLNFTSVFGMPRLGNTTFDWLNGHDAAEKLTAEPEANLTQNLGIAPLLGRYTNSPLVNDFHYGIILKFWF